MRQAPVDLLPLRADRQQQHRRRAHRTRQHVEPEGAAHQFRPWNVCGAVATAPDTKHSPAPTRSQVGISATFFAIAASYLLATAIANSAPGRPAIPIAPPPGSAAARRRNEIARCTSASSASAFWVVGRNWKRAMSVTTVASRPERKGGRGVMRG